MAHDEKAGLIVVNAKHHASSIETDVSVRELSEAVMAGKIAIVKNVFDPHEIRRLRAAIISAQIPICEMSFEYDTIRSWRDHREVFYDPKVKVLYEASYFAVTNPADKIGQIMRAAVERMAVFWRSLTGYEHTLVPSPDRRALRPWAMYYPAGGGCFGWHQHPLEFTRIGPILALSEIGVDFRRGGTEFNTPFGLINVERHHDIGDICLFRFDLPHRVTTVDPDQELQWNGSGRWTLVLQGDPRPPDVSVR
jgi:hypothetical protein